MAAEIGEEIRVEWDGARRQHALGGLQQLRLGLVARDFLLLVDSGGGHQLDALERLAVDLARGEFW